MVFDGRILAPEERVIVANRDKTGLQMAIAKLLKQQRSPAALLRHQLWSPEREYGVHFRAHKFPEFNGKLGKSLDGKVVYIINTASSRFSKEDLTLRNYLIACTAKRHGARDVRLVTFDLWYSAEDRAAQEAPWFDKVQSTVNRRRLEDLAERAKMDGHGFTSYDIAGLYHSAGISHILCYHNHSTELMNLIYDNIYGEGSNAFIDVEVSPLIGTYLAESDLVDHTDYGKNVLFIAPDSNARDFTESVRGYSGLEKSASASMKKLRDEDGNIIGYNFDEGNEHFDKDRGLKGMTAIICDDRIRSGKTMAESIKYFSQQLGQRPQRWILYTSHTNLDTAEAYLNDPLITDIIVFKLNPTIRDALELESKLTFIEPVKPTAYLIPQCLELGISPTEALTVEAIKENGLLSISRPDVHYSHYRGL